ncbi:MAG: hypothetical protein S0880_27040 [Actinomycetota bacterium]|nr:hypothetical protein [Actinomycetota bacterium]
MLRRDIDEGEIGRAIAELSADEPQTGQIARFAWDSLTAGEGPSAITRARLQRWLWGFVPKRWAGRPDAWSAAATACAALFDALDEPAYAEICRSDTTRAIHRAWRRSNRAGRTAMARAMTSSRTEPPPVDGLQWGTVFGSWEAGARKAVERELESAIDGGRLVPGRRNALDVARSVCADVVDAPHPEAIGQSWRSLIVTERVDAWAGSHHATAAQRRRRVDAAPHLLTPPDPPHGAELAENLEPLRWLAERCRGGVRLTATHRLPPAVAAEAAARFGWGPAGRPPRREDEVGQLGEVRETARRLGICRRTGETLLTTATGRRLLDDPTSHWSRWTATLGGREPAEQGVAEVLALAVLEAGPGEGVDLLEALSRPCDGHGERAIDPVRDRAAIRASVERWRVWRLLDESAPISERGWRVVRPASTLTGVGAAALVSWLHQQATRPPSRH